MVQEKSEGKKKRRGKGKTKTKEAREEGKKHIGKGKTKEGKKLWFPKARAYYARLVKWRRMLEAQDKDQEKAKTKRLQQLIESEHGWLAAARRDNYPPGWLSGRPWESPEEEVPGTTLPQAQAQVEGTGSKKKGRVKSTDKEKLLVYHGRIAMLAAHGWRCLRHPGGTVAIQPGGPRVPRHQPFTVWNMNHY
jgi:hypothetical protein